MSQRIASLFAEIGANTSGLEAGLNKSVSLLEGGAKKMQDALGKVGSNIIDPQRALQAASDFSAIAGGAIGVFTALGFAGKQIYTFTRDSAELEYSKIKFDNLSASINTTSDLLLNDMRIATKGLYSDAQLVKQGGDIMELGLAKTHDEAVRLSTVAGALNMDMDQLVLTLTNQTTRRFDSLGVSTDGFKEKLKKLEQQGYSTEVAFNEAFLRQAEEQIQKVGNVADSDFGAYLKAEASMQNYFDSMKRGREDAIVPYLKTAQTLLDVQTRANQLMSSGEATHYRAALYQASVERALTTPKKTEFGRAGDDVYTSGVASTAMQQYAMDVGIVLDSGLKLSEMTADYTTKLDAMNAKLSETSALYGENSSQAIALQDQIGQLSTAHTNAMDTMALKTLQAKEATDQMQLDFALASGMLTQSGYDQAVMMDRLASAYINGQLNASQYSAAVGQVSSMVAGLNGMSAAAYIDVYIRVHGDSSLVGNNFTMNSSGTGVVKRNSVSGQIEERRAIGGPVQSGNMYEVNEGGAPELLSVGGKTFLMMGSKGGYVSPAGNSSSGGGNSELAFAIASKIPSATENAKALARELVKMWS